MSSHVCTIESDGSNLQYITQTPIHLRGMPIWSRNGQNIRFTQGNYIDDDHYITEIYEYCLYVNEATTITEMSMGGSIKWTPNRSTLILESFTDERYEIFKMDLIDRNIDRGFTKSR